MSLNYDEAEELKRFVQPLIKMHNDLADKPKELDKNILEVVIVPINTSYERIMEIYEKVKSGVDNKSIFEKSDLIFELRFIIGNEKEKRMTILQKVREVYPLYFQTLR